LLQFGFGHLKGFDRRREEAGRERVVLARGVVVVVAPADGRGFVNDMEERGEGEGTREVGGEVAGVLLLEKRRAGGTQPCT
jgi:hypothetical protein